MESAFIDEDPTQEQIARVEDLPQATLHQSGIRRVVRSVRGVYLDDPSLPDLTRELALVVELEATPPPIPPDARARRSYPSSLRSHRRWREERIDLDEILAETAHRPSIPPSKDESMSSMTSHANHPALPETLRVLTDPWLLLDEHRRAARAYQLRCYTYSAAAGAAVGAAFATILSLIVRLA